MKHELPTAVTPARLIRPVAAAELPPATIAWLDVKHNIVFVDGALWAARDQRLKSAVFQLSEDNPFLAYAGE